MRQVILQRAQIGRLVYVINCDLVPDPRRYYIRIVPYPNRDTHIVRANRRTTATEVSTTGRAEAPRIVPLGAIQSD
jgi:hypothetical protein